MDYMYLIQSYMYVDSVKGCVMSFIIVKGSVASW